jgi:hypothetical protein
MICRGVGFRAYTGVNTTSWERLDMGFFDRMGNLGKGVVRTWLSDSPTDRERQQAADEALKAERSAGAAGAETDVLARARAEAARRRAAATLAEEKRRAADPAEAAPPVGEDLSEEDRKLTLLLQMKSEGLLSEAEFQAKVDAVAAEREADFDDPPMVKKTL